MSAASRFRDPGLRRLILSFVVILFLGGIQLPLWQWISTTAQVLQDRRTINQQITNLNEQLELLQEERQSEGIIDEQLSVVLIDEVEISQAVERLESLAQARGLEIQIHSINKADAKAGAAVSPLTITATASGSVDKILEYIEAIEQVSEITYIDDFFINPVSRLENGVTVTNHSFGFNVVFAGEAIGEETGGTEPDNRFATTDPAPPASDLTNRIGSILLIISIFAVVGLVGYRILEKRRKT